MSTRKRSRCNHECAHDSGFAVVSGVRGDDETTMSEPAIVCRRCGALQHTISWNPDQWSEPIGDDVPSFLESCALLVHETNIRTREDADKATRRAWERWVDVGGYGRRLLFGHLRPEEIERAERDASAHARAT